MEARAEARGDRLHGRRARPGWWPRWKYCLPFFALAPGWLLAAGRGDFARVLGQGFYVVVPLGALAIAGAVVADRAARAMAVRRATPAACAAPWDHDGYESRSGEARSRRLCARVPYARPLAAGLVVWAATLPDLPFASDLPTQWIVALVLASVAVACALYFRGVAHGHVAYGRFPFRVGERVSLAFHFDKPRGPPLVFDRLALTLQCVRERRRLRGLWPPEARRVLAETVVRHDESPPSPFTIPVTFDVPADAPGTDFGVDAPTYWELAVEGEVAGLRYEDVFLVPIYARPA
jgi:hypothetical protein